MVLSTPTRLKRSYSDTRLRERSKSSDLPDTEKSFVSLFRNQPPKKKPCLHHADPSVKYGNTPLHIAAQQNKFEILEELLNTFYSSDSKYGFNINTKNYAGRTFLDEALFSLSYESTCVLLKFMNKNFEFFYFKSKTAISFELLVKLNKVLLRANKTENNSYTKAVVLKFIKQLLSENFLQANLQEKFFKNINLISYGMIYFQIELIEILFGHPLFHSSYLNAKSLYPPIFDVLERQNEDIIRLFLSQKHIDLSKKTPLGTPLLIRAARIYLDSLENEKRDCCTNSKTSQTALTIFKLFMNDERLNLLDTATNRPVSFLKFVQISEPLRKESALFFKNRFFFAANLLPQLLRISSDDLNKYTENNYSPIVQHKLSLSTFKEYSPPLFDNAVIWEALFNTYSLENVLITFASQILNPFRYLKITDDQNLMILVRIDCQQKTLSIDLYDAQHLYQYLESGLAVCPVTNHPISTVVNPSDINPQITYLLPIFKNT